jgi:NAD(P)-dependent dehydrogenase (short-subunit alcohol dehydrogenase family)
MFAAEGANVVILDRDGAGAEKVAATIGGSAMAACVDVTSEDQVRDAMRAAAERFGTIHALVNNAGVAVRRSASELEDEDWKRVIDVNLRGAFLCSKYALPYVAQQGGSIIHMASIVGITGVRNRAAYAASKGGLVALTRNMAMDYAEQRVRVNCICPGFVRTPFTAAWLAEPGRDARLTSLHPLGRLGEPEDIAKAVLFLASDDSSWITGQVIAVDGGFTAGSTLDI